MSSKAVESDSIWRPLLSLVAVKSVPHEFFPLFMAAAAIT